MLHALCGTGTVRVPPAAMDGPPKVPAAPRVSITRQGVTVTNSSPEVVTSPVCVTVKVSPPIESVPMRCAVLVFAATLKATDPLPVPAAPEVMASQETLLAAVHEAVDEEAVTWMVPL